MLFWLSQETVLLRFRTQKKREALSLASRLEAPRMLPCLSKRATHKPHADMYNTTTIPIVAMGY